MTAHTEKTTPLFNLGARVRVRPEVAQYPAYRVIAKFFGDTEYCVIQKGFAPDHVRIASVHRNPEGEIVRTPGPGWDSYITTWERCFIDVKYLELISEGDGKTPVLGKDYSASRHEVFLEAYSSVDHTWEGWSNRPTAFLAQFILTSAAMRLELKRAATSKNVITDKKVHQLTVRGRGRWLQEAVPHDAYYTSPFPETEHFYQGINYVEISKELTRLLHANEL